jgi:hypothetical protein
MEAPEPFVVNSTAGNSAPFGGRRRHRLKLVTKKRARKVLSKMGLKFRGGADKGPEDAPVAVPAEMAPKDAPAAPAMGGRRHRKTKKAGRRHKRRSLFGMKY